jgi:tRNA-splicing ligase RtcB (3'-phosphate/5'-hydroxy nucleic acid ligase)
MSDPLAPHRVDDELWEIGVGAVPGMRVPARVFADSELLAAIARDRSLEQLANVATLPGIVDAALAMPDIHQGYGFPVGGVAATDASEGVISPGGVGYDINCGVRLLALPLGYDELPGDRRERLVHELSRNVPVGTGGRGAREGVRGASLDRVLTLGPRALLDDLGIGSEEELAFTESEGCLGGADAATVSARARERGAGQIGTLGSGNHFLELQRVEAVYEARAAEAFGLRLGQLTVLIHSGSRGLGHQVCTDFVKRMDAQLGHYGIELPDRQLSCAPVASVDGRDYLTAMAAAANFAWANRAALAHRTREAVRSVLGREAAAATRQVYDVAHNVAKLEEHGGRRVCVHRKGATRAFPPGHPEIPPEYAAVGQPVFIPGSMGTASFVLAGRPGAMERSFGTTCHGAGRRMSRTAARKAIDGGTLRRRLEASGIVVRGPTARGLAEEAPEAYKDVDRVVEIVERAGLAARVVRLRPVGVVKG